MHFMIIGVDAPAFGSGRGVNARHQRYLDGYADRLVARGPTLARDGRTHTGSVHVLDVADRAAAQRFAEDEPYARAGWYARIEVSRLHPCLPGTMWDRPAVGSTSALVRAAGLPDMRADETARRLGERLGAETAWIHVGVLGDDDDRATGVLALVDAEPAEARQAVTGALAGLGLGDVGVDAVRWRRGGRGPGPALVMSRLVRSVRAWKARRRATRR